MTTSYLFVEAPSAPEPVTQAPRYVANDGFAPEIEAGDFETKYQLDQSYSSARREACLAEAMQVVNSELAELVCAWLRTGYLSLAAVPSAEINGESVLVASYRLAVYCKAMQLLTSRYRSTDTKDYAVPKATAYEEAAAYWQGEYLRHLRVLCNTAFMELI